MSIIDELRECDEHKGPCNTCDHFLDCIVKFPDLKIGEKIRSAENNPSMMAAELRNFDDVVYNNDLPNSKSNYNINISELSNSMIRECIDNVNSVSLDDKLKNVVIASLNKNISENTSSSTINADISKKINAKFECSDCKSTNMVETYVFRNSITLYCSFCGKKHTFLISGE